MNISQLRNFHKQLYYYERLKEFSDVYQEEEGYLSAIGLIQRISIDSLGVQLRLKDDETWKDELYAEVKKEINLENYAFANSPLDEAIKEEIQRSSNKRLISSNHLMVNDGDFYVKLTHPLIQSCFDNKDGYWSGSGNYQLLKHLETHNEAGYHLFFH